MKGPYQKSHNVLTVSDIHTIFKSEYCNQRHAEGYRNRLVFAVGLGLGIRTSELHGLLVRELKRETFNGINAWVFYPEIGSVEGKSKNRRGGI